MTRLLARLRALFALLAASLLLPAAPGTGSETTARKSYDLPNGLATATLREFISQSGVQLLYVADEHQSFAECPSAPARLLLHLAVRRADAQARL